MSERTLRRSTRYTLVAVIALAVMAVAGVWIVNAQAQAQSLNTTTVEAAAVPPQLIIDRDFPDPDISRFGDTYYAYSTNSGPNLPVATASSIDGTWTVSDQDALPQLGAWAQPGRTWAPDVSQRPDGSYLLYYAAHSVNPDRQCIGAAVAGSPLGPFVPVGNGPLVCPAELGGAIDAASFSEGDDHYLIYKTDGNAVGLRPGIYLQRTGADGVQFRGDPVRIMENDQDAERNIIEAPVLLKQGGNYVLLYSGGEYWNGSYFSSYAVSETITGPYTKAYRPLMTNDSLDGAVDGPGGADIIRGDTDHIVFHGHLPAGGRGVYVADLGWANDYPVVRGSRVRYEAESGDLNNCRVRTEAHGASQGAVAAYIDHVDSYVDISVFAPSAGRHQVVIGFANGSVDGAQHTLKINGEQSTVVGYPFTGWDNWMELGVAVELESGWNTIRLNHRSSYAELDYIEVS